MIEIDMDLEEKEDLEEMEDSVTILEWIPVMVDMVPLIMWLV
jgi:hypothetical protein